MREEQELRDAIVAEARSWIGTRYHGGACVKGAGVDCATLIYGVMIGADIIEKEEIGIFSPDWFCHTTDDVYMRRVVRHAYKLVEGKTYPSLEAKPGCICMIKTADSRVYNHGMIVTKWPMVVHAIPPAVDEVDASRSPLFMHRNILVFDPIPAYFDRMNNVR